MDWSPIFISLKTAAVSILFTFFLGLLAAWWVFSLKNKWLKIIIDGIFTLPMVLPPTVAGFFLLYVLGVNRPIGKVFIHLFNYKIAFSWWATVIAAVVISFPLMYRSAKAAFEQVDNTYIQAARTLGMPEWKIFVKVILPQAKPGVASGGILAFARGLGEFGATAMIAGNIAGKTRTLPLAISSAVPSGDMQSAGVYVGILLVIAFLMIIGLNCLSTLGNKPKTRGRL